MLKPPLLWPSIDSSESEAAAIKDLYANLWGVAYNVEAWNAALQLYEYAKQAPNIVSRDLVRQWRFIASQECVMQLHHLKERLQKIRGFKLRECHSLTDSFDTSALRKATKLFDEYFPNIDQLRHAVAHAGSNDTNPAKHAPDGLFGLVGFRETDRFSAPYEGEVRHLDITAATLDKINEVVAEFFHAFEAAAHNLEQQGHAD